MKKLLALGTVVSALVVAAPAAADGNADAASRCQHEGWRTLMRSDGTPFANQGECVGYGAQGGTIAVIPVVDVLLAQCPESFGTATNACVFASAAGLQPGSTLQVTAAMVLQGEALPPLEAGFPVDSDGAVEQKTAIAISCSGDSGALLTITARAVGTAPDGTTVSDTDTTVLVCD
jgi:hypothetical protein